MTEVSEIVRAVTNLIQSSRNQTLYGAALGSLLRLRFPGFHPQQYGARNLREFMGANVPGVTVQRTDTSADVMYSLAQAHSLEAGAPVLEERENPEAEHSFATETVWKAFVSPNTPFRIFVDPSRSVVRLLPLQAERLGPPWLQLPPVSAEAHFRIARDFVDALPPGPPREALERALGQSMWWKPFFALARSFGLGDQWTGFRKTALEGHFREALRALAVPGAESAVLTPQPLPRRRAVNLPVSASTQKRDAQSVHMDVPDLRRLAVAIVSQLNDSELRELRFRLGDVVASLRGNG